MKPGPVHRRCVAFLWRGSGRAKCSFGCFAGSSQCCQALAGGAAVVSGEGLKPFTTR
jgi:hypothetical protein